MTPTPNAAGYVRCRRETSITHFAVVNLTLVGVGGNAFTVPTGFTSDTLNGGTMAIGGGASTSNQPVTISNRSSLGTTAILGASGQAIIRSYWMLPAPPGGTWPTTLPGTAA